MRLLRTLYALVFVAFVVGPSPQAPDAPVEELKNGGFSAGQAGWRLVTSHGARADFAVEPAPVLGSGPSARVTVRRPTFTCWQIALQSKLALSAGRRYRVAFDVAAGRDGLLDVCLQDADPPYRILLLSRLDVDASRRHYAFLTPPVPSEKPKRLAFWFGDAPAGDYWIDNVSVRALRPEEQAGLESMAEGFENGDFSAGLRGWELRTHRGAVGELSIDPSGKLGDGNCARVDVLHSTDITWHIQLMQVFKVRKGKRYCATFTAAVEPAGPIVVSFQVPPPDNAVLSAHELDITAAPRAYSVTSAPAKRDSEMKLSFHLSGAGKRTFWLDKVEVRELKTLPSELAHKGSG